MTTHAREGAARWLLLLGIVLVAINLRPTLASVGPLVQDIRAGTGLSNTELGLITTLPLIAFGVISLFASRVSRAIGLERAIGLALVLIGGGAAWRVSGPVSALYLGTAMLGVGIALGNVLLPALAKRDFDSMAGPITSLYSSMMGLGATAAAGLSVPLAASLGWRGSLGIWAAPAGVALVVWAPQMLGGPTARKRRNGAGGIRRLARSPLAWQVALFMGLQSLTFYVVIAWIPDLLQSRGIGEATAGGLLAINQAAGIAGSALIPIWAGRRDDQRRIVWTLGWLEAIGFAGLLLPGGAVLAGVWMGLLGFILGGTFALALTFLVLRTSDADTASDLSGMAQSVGYLVAAAGPTLFGLLFDATGGWTVPLLFLVLVLVGKVASGLPAACPRTIES
jgi:CP family cyanate transporter-like MFS transporter